MSTCVWTVTILPLRTGWKSHNLYFYQIVTLDLISRGGLGAGTILGGAGGSSVINSLKSYPDLIKKYQVSSIEYQVSSTDLIKKYQGLSKKPPELEKFGPIIELINTQNMKPAQVNILSGN